MLSLLPIHARHARDRMKGSCALATQADLAAAEMRIEMLITAATSTIVSAIKASGANDDSEIESLTETLKQTNATLQKAVDENA